MNAPVNTTVLPYNEMQEYALQFFHEHANEKLVYHDLVHTQDVVSAVTQIANHYHLNDNDFFIVLTAAWFHDTGHFIDGNHHEEKGAELAETWLRNNHVDETMINAIKDCILATKMPQHATNLMEEIVCDADLFHLGTDEFDNKNKLLRREYILLTGKEISKDEWRHQTISLLESHHYYTDYCRLLLNKKKQENLEDLKKKESKKETEKEKKALSEGNIQQLPEEKTKDETHQKKDEAAKKKKKDPSRGIDTTFKITATNNQRLSSQADSKAHIMIQVNSIIISVLLSMLFRSLDQYRYLVIPATLLLSVNVLTIIFSVLATRPKIAVGTFDKEDIDNQKVNLLFFGNYYKMSLEEYVRGMQAMLEEYDYLYMNLIRDVYFQGKVLGRKYHLLRISYNVFMYGLVLSVLAFVIAIVMFSGN